jgi:DNA end-binding protein Ku
MPSTIWSGSISFGLVTVPVKLYSAVQSQTVRFHQFDKADHSRIRHASPAILQARADPG